MSSLNKDSRVDLHMHTNASDGTLNPEELIRDIVQNHIELISITDHDEIENVEKMKQLTKENNVSFIPRIEISSTFNGKLYHILAYGTDNTNKQLLELIDNNKKMLENRNNESIRYLIDKGYEIDIEQYENYNYDRKRGGWKTLNFLIDKGFCRDVGDYFNRLFYKEKTILFPVFSSSDEVIKVIKSAGGIPILAHPYYEKNEDDVPVDERLSIFLDMGIEGVECFHPNHSKNIMKECNDWCRGKGVIITAGSDFHGGLIETRRLGTPEARIKDIYLGKLENLIII